MTWRAVTDQPWARMEAPRPKRHPHRRGGRTRLRDRPRFEGLLWILWTGAPWSERPMRHGSQSAVHSRRSEWATNGDLLNVWRTLLDPLNDTKKIRWHACVVDGMSITANTGATVWAQPHPVRGRRSHRPHRLIASRGDDSNRVRALLVKRDIEPVVPKRRHHTVATHQDGRKLRRYRQRWIMERTNSWRQNCRRLVVRYERAARNFEALV